MNDKGTILEKMFQSLFSSVLIPFKHTSYWHTETGVCVCVYIYIYIYAYMYFVTVIIFRLDCKELDVLLSELVLLNTRAELYLRFMKKRALVSIYNI